MALIHKISNKYSHTIGEISFYNFTAEIGENFAKNLKISAHFRHFGWNFGRSVARFQGGGGLVMEIFMRRGVIMGNFAKFRISLDYRKFR